jgi:hypothetical protein
MAECKAEVSDCTNECLGLSTHAKMRINTMATNTFVSYTYALTHCITARDFVNIDPFGEEHTENKADSQRRQRCR